MRLQSLVNPAIRPLTSVIGAEITGIDLARTSTSDIEFVSKALLEHKVLFFRDQELDDRAHADFAAHFGVPQLFAFLPPVAEDVPEVHALSSGGTKPKRSNADIWHSDATFQSTPPMGSILRSLVSPTVGGDTLWANMEAAYEALSPRLQEMLDGMTATHDFKNSSTHRNHPLGDVYPPISHPVVRTHPVTGRKSLYVNRTFTTRIDGLSERENEMLLPFLCDHVRGPEFQCRFTWAAGSVAFWDNRCTQHYAVADYTQPRLMHRVVIDGDRPF
ncbi:hypothetical protein B2J88_02475 [Rhodococcus sp. SRB_17]|nr:hypothetical protein [Rhodococcus sp. SRB_17]